MNEIGGYFELELNDGEHYHKEALRLNTARNCFKYVLLARGYKRVYMPYYTCEVMLQPLMELNIRYDFYHVNESLEPVELPELESTDAFLYTNYYGLKQSCVERLANHYRSQLIVDNAQAFYASPLEGIDTFYSARKFFGVPDGAYLYTTRLLDMEFERDKSYSRVQHLLQRIDEGAEEAYGIFKENEGLLDNQPIKEMSRLTERILRGIDYEKVKKRRIENFLYLDKELGKMNKFQLTLPKNSVPMVYPFLTDNGGYLRSKLIANKIFVAQYWPNVLEWCKQDSIEYKLTSGVVPLPIDQRYSKLYMNEILKMIGL